MKLKRLILLLQTATCASVAAAASSTSLHALPSPLAVPSASPWSTAALRRRHDRRGIAFMVPRGGDDGGAPDGVADDDDDDYVEDEEGNSLEMTEDDADDSAEVSDGGMAEESEEGGAGETTPSAQPHFSFLPSSCTSLTSTVVHYASILLRITKRSIRAGTRAIMKGDEENSDRPGGAVYTFIGRTGHVLGEMYHAAMTPSSGNDGDGEEEALLSDHEDESGRERTRRRRRRRRRRGEERSQQTATAVVTAASCPTAIVSNGGGMEPSASSSSDSNRAITDLAEKYDILDKLPSADEGGQLPIKYRESILPSSQFTLQEALQIANGNARFLICYISRSSDKSNNGIAVPNLLSPDVVKIANRKPLGKKQSSETRSYYIWITDGSDRDAEAASKRLKVKPSASRSKSKSSGGGRRPSGGGAPILAIVYPASTVDASTGKMRVSPRVLAQHHCRPPPATPESMASWMTALRKRHLREYAKLQHDRREFQLLEERTRGYESSVKEDAEREGREREAEEARARKEEEERLRLQGLEDRREALLEELVDEPEAGAEGAMTIALRFGDGRRDQRRFDRETTRMNDVFNWIDATHKLERERVELSTMNGSRKFVYVEEGDDDGDGSVTLEDAGLGKMTALRVTEILRVEDEDEEGESGDKDNEEEYDEGESSSEEE